MTGDKEDGRDMNVVISGILKYGVLISSVLIACGILLILAQPPSGFPGSVGQLIGSNYGRPTLSVHQLFAGVARGGPLFVIQLGLIALLATPMVRVAASVLLFAEQKDRIYVAITSLVLLILLLSVFAIGPAVAHATS